MNIHLPVSPPVEKFTRIGVLCLKDGSMFAGYSFGSNVNVSGECVFQTGMVGYPEALTDPSYKGQILIPTYPLIGNYGVPKYDDYTEYHHHGDSKDTSSRLPKYLESFHIHVSGLVISQYSTDYFHFQALCSLSDWLVKENIPALYGLDTRVITQKIREHGVLLGKLIITDNYYGVEAKDMNGSKITELVESLSWYDPNICNIVSSVSIKTPVFYTSDHFNENRDPTLIAVDVGMKANQIRHFLSRNIRVKVVPHDFDYLSELSTFDGLFISNGPGDPTQCVKTIAYLKGAIEKAIIPIFGICLGHQLMALAIGAKTKKMTFGNRGHNIPCKNLKTKQCYITSQNHGFAVQVESLPRHWEPLFVNVNDGSNEGMICKDKPFFTVQFHPEAAPGPKDTEYLFDVFDQTIREFKRTRILTPIIFSVPEVRYKPSLKNIKKILILGSGGLSIGQAGEFDYSGSQAIKALKEENIYTILINPNIATIQTSKGLADKVYFLPVQADFVRKVIEYEKPDGIYVTFGGQTALNTGVQMKDEFEGLGVQVLGTPIEAIIATEDREIFAQKLAEINERCAPSASAVTVKEALEAAKTIGYPVICRAAYALGGLGSGFAHNESQLTELCKKAFSVSPQVLVEKSLKGWKEIEVEVVRDAYDNCITVCNMENFDPLGIHTGDSIVVAPSQTLSDEDYQMLRTTAIKVIRHLGVIGECNIQYALSPTSSEYCIIEVNARLSRSSALASKATGYPLAFVAAKLGLGVRLDEIRNLITKKTMACFEPSLDYVVVKLPRWDLKKFSRVSKKISSAMKSVGEVMAIGRNFEEAIQKGIRALDLGIDGFMKTGISGSDSHITDECLEDASDERLFYIANAFYEGYSVERIHALTRIDKWFLYRLCNIYQHSLQLEQTPFSQLSPLLLKKVKCYGFSDRQIATMVNSSELAIRQLRKDWKLTPFVKQIDTVAAEFPCATNYLYHTYNALASDVTFEDHGVFVIGSGVYRIGSSVEFDWCAVRCIRTLRAAGLKTILLNYNPETVSTDFDEADRLYFENITLETVLDIYEQESAAGAIVSMGGQMPNNIALALSRCNVKIFGTLPEMIDTAENRYKFSRLLDRIHVDQPLWKELTNLEDAKQFCANVSGYPVLVRPSYVLSGAAMNVVFSENDLESYLKQATAVSKEYPVVISKYIEEAKEIEMDAVAKDGLILHSFITEHVENAGVHSGDATLILPPQDLDPETIEKINLATIQIAMALNVTGPLNIQFIAKMNTIKVIECNLRASRSFPFVSKVMDVDLIELATKAMLGLAIPPAVIASLTPVKTPLYIAVKVPQFSFGRLSGADPILGVEMASTGEVAAFGRDKYEAYIKALLATSFKLPPKGGNILLSIGSFKEKTEFCPFAKKLANLGYHLFATSGTADFLQEHDIPVKYLEVFQEGGTGIKSPVLGTMDKDSSNLNQRQEYSLEQALSTKHIHLYINLPSKNKFRRPANYMSRGYVSRRMAVDMAIPLITNIKCAKLFTEALTRGYTEVKDFVLLPEIDAKTTENSLKLNGFIDLYPVKMNDVKKLEDLAKSAITLKAILDHKDTNASLPFNYILSIGNSTSMSTPGLIFIDQGYINSKMHTHLYDGFHNLLSMTHHYPLLVDLEGPLLATLLLYVVSTHSGRVHILNVTRESDLKMILLLKKKRFPISFSVSFDVMLDNQYSYLWNYIHDIDAFVMKETTSNFIPKLCEVIKCGKLTPVQWKEKCHDFPIKLLGLQMDCSKTFIELSLDRVIDNINNTGLLVRVVNNNTTVVMDGQLVVSKDFSSHLVQCQPITTTLALPHVKEQPQPIESNETTNLLCETEIVAPLPPSILLNTTVVTKSILKPTKSFHNINIISVNQFKRSDLHYLFSVAQEMRQACTIRKSEPLSLLSGKMICNLFYEPSTRTCCSFEAAMIKLGGQVIKVNEISSSSISKGESLQDTIRTLGTYVDAIVLRHSNVGSAQLAVQVSSVPVINAGDGIGEHPTQALLDIFTIREELGTVNGLTVVFVGDLKHGRTVHSLVKLLALYSNIRIIYVPAHPDLDIPSKLLDEVKSIAEYNNNSLSQSTHHSLEEVLPVADVLYMTRIQKERFPIKDSSFNYTTTSFKIDNKILKRAKPSMIIMHPLPRNDEIDPEVDFDDKRAAYFRQMKYGLYIRMSLLYLLLTPPESSL